MSEPTAQSDPEGYLASIKFSRSLRCKRTSKRVSYADIGDPNGVPLLMLMPSGCSRWFAAPHDPLAVRYGIRLIAVDRPGVGATEPVPLEERIPLSCQIIVSVLEHLEVRPRHILAHSAGMYYALQLLVHHADAFTMNPSDPLPFLYLVAPWSPLLPSSHPDHYTSPLAWIPPKLIETQHLTMPHLLTVAKSAMAAWDVASSTIRAGLAFARSSLFNNAEEAGRPDGQSGMSLAQESQTSHVTLETPDRPTAEPEVNGEKLWGKVPCCIGCTTTAYFQAESTQGVGQEHLICLNHGPRDTGPDWLEQKLDEVARQVRDRCAVSGTQAKLDVDIWWGLRDKMVPRQGQLWFTKTVKSHPDEIAVEVHEVADGDHSDLLGRVEGIHRVYGMIWERSGGGERRQQGSV